MAPPPACFRNSRAIFWSNTLKRKTTFMRKIVSILFVSATVSACAGRPRVDSLIAQLPAEMSVANFVSHNGDVSGNTIRSGGVINGREKFEASAWFALVETKTKRANFILLLPVNYRSTVTETLARDARILSGLLEKKIDSSISALEMLLGKHAPRLVVSFRLIPLEASFYHDSTTTRNADGSYSLEFVAPLPRSANSHDEWLSYVTDIAMHEFIHTLRWRPEYFSKVITKVEDEIQSYFLGKCISVLSGSTLPGVFVQFPDSLAEAMHDFRDAPIDEVIRQLASQKIDAPTTIGDGIALLAMHRYLQAIVRDRKQSLGPNDVLPVCAAVARDDLPWRDPSIDQVITKIANRAHSPHAKESVAN